ncbi:ATP-binding protein [Pontibacter locisalis]|uniref:histidine kinase n=1 Tax=Pontibacter locisalis TaxID=1719035 RepID=A0ABW5IF96_9BACT
MKLSGDALLDALFDNPGIGIALISKNGCLKRCNPSLYRMLGYNPLELQHAKLEDILLKDDFANYSSRLESIMAGKEDSSEVEKRVVRKDGQVLWVQFKTSLVHTTEGEPLAVAFMKEMATQPISRSHKLQRLLIKLATQLVNIPLEQLNDTMHRVLSEVGSFADVDRAYVFKYDFEAQTFSNIHEWCAPGISPEIETMQQLPIEIISDIARAHQAGVSFHIPRVSELPQHSDLYKLLAPQQIKTLITVPMFTDGRCLGFIGFDSVARIREWKEDEIGLLTILAELLTNAENRRLSELALQENVERFKGLFDLSPVGIVLNDFETGRFVEANQAFLLNTGYTLDELQHMILEDLECSSRLFPDSFTADGTFGPDEKEIFNRDGSYRQVLQSGMQFYDKDGRRMLWSILQDISEIKAYHLQLETALALNTKTNEKLKIAIDNAEQANKAKENFLANMSHEIRTPMNGIMGISKLLSKTCLTPQQQNYLSTIRHSAKNLLVIINDILDLAKIKSGKLEFEQIPFDIQESLKTTYRTLSYKAEEKGIDFKIHPLAIDNPVIVGDPYRLNQILLNLTSNAIKFTAKGSVTVTSEITRETVDSITLSFTVADTGIGIAEDKLEKIFEGFTQAYSSTTRKHGGTGLGLSISKHLVELQNGTLGVKSEAGKGSKFYFELSFSKMHSYTEPKQVEGDMDFSLLNKRRVLLAEDNEINSFVAKTVMEGWGLVVDTAFNGLEAVGLAKENQYDVILMDIQMPELSGLDATQQIRLLEDDRKARTPIIALTANAIKGDDKKYLQAGMDDYVSKPFEEEVLFHKIIRLVNKVCEGVN